MQHYGILLYISREKIIDKISFLLFPPEGLFTHKLDAKFAIDEMIHLKLIEFADKEGCKLKNSDYGNYILNLKTQADEKESEEKELQLKKLKYDIKISERVVKSYKSTRFIAWASFIVALLLGLLKLAESLKLWPYHK